MKPFLRNKKIILCVGVILLAVMLFWLTANFVHAGPTVPTGATGFFNRAAGKGIDVLSMMVTVVLGLWVLQGILNTLLAFAVFLFNNIFKYGIIMYPLGTPVIVEAWGVMRDIANALFILIILWIAITIVLNIERLGGRKLLIRVIIVALLTNLSLAIVSVVFAFANYLSHPFVKAIGPNVGDVIVNNSRIHTVVNTLSDSDFKKMVDEANRGAQEEAKGQTAPPASTTLLPFLPQKGPAVAHAGPAGSGAAGCGFGAIIGTFIPIAGQTGIGQGVGCVGGALIGAVVGFLASWAITAFSFPFAFKMALNLAIGNILLILVTFTLMTAMIVLLYRIVAMFFLSVLAPGAFLLYATPGGEKYWNIWLNKLFTWAFYAPAFAFVFWLSLIMLQEMSKSLPVGPTQIPADLYAVFNLVIFIAFMLASLKVAHFMGITVADRAVSWGQKIGFGALGFAGGLAAGGLRMAKDATLRGALKEEGWIHKGLRGAQAIPGLRPLAGVGTEARAQKMRALQEGVDKRAKELGALYKGKPNDLLAAYRGAQTAPEKAAAAKALGKYSAQLRPNEASEALTFTEKFGMQKDILKVLPYLAEERHVKTGAKSKMEAVRKYTAEELDYSDIKNIDPSSVLAGTGDTPDVKTFKQEARIGLWSNKNFSPAGLARLADEDRAAAQALLDDIDPLYNELLGYAPPRLTKNLNPGERTTLLNTLDTVHKPAFQKYFSGTMGRSLSLVEPTAW